MKWFFKWLRDSINNVDSIDKAREEKIYSGRGMAIGQSTLSSGGSVLDSSATLTFSVYNAIGGKVIEFRRYDRRTDQSEHSVYVIGKDEDFGQKISKIATLEVMK